MIAKRTKSTTAPDSLIAAICSVVALFLLSITVPSLVLAQTDEAEASFEESTEQSETLDGVEPENEPEPEPESAEETQQDQEINPDASFTPTEEISEDKPVAFPVDI